MNFTKICMQVKWTSKISQSKREEFLAGLIAQHQLNLAWVRAGPTHSLTLCCRRWNSQGINRSLAEMKDRRINSKSKWAAL